MSEFKWPGIPDVNAHDFLPRVKQTLELLTTGRTGVGQVPPGIKAGIDEAEARARAGANEDLGTFIQQVGSNNDVTQLLFRQGFDADRFAAYDFLFDGIRPSVAGIFRLRLSSDGGATLDSTSGNYKWVTEQWATDTGTSAVASSITSTGFHIVGTINVDTIAAAALSGRCRVYVPTEGVNRVSVIAETVYKTTTGNTVSGFFTGRFDVNERVNGVGFDFVGLPTITSGRIVMHGVRKA